MKMCDANDAKLMSDALMNHARDIYRYATSFCLATPANREVDARQREKFAKTVLRMVEGMRALLLLARYKGISRFCNLEQIDACMDGALSALENRETAAVLDSRLADW